MPPWKPSCCGPSQSSGTPHGLARPPKTSTSFTPWHNAGWCVASCYTTASGEQVVAVHGPTPDGRALGFGRTTLSECESGQRPVPHESRLRLTRPTPQHHARKAAKNSSSSRGFCQTPHPPPGARRPRANLQWRSSSARTPCDPASSPGNWASTSRPVPSRKNMSSTSTSHGSWRRVARAPARHRPSPPRAPRPALPAQEPAFREWWCCLLRGRLWVSAWGQALEGRFTIPPHASGQV